MRNGAALVLLAALAACAPKNPGFHPPVTATKGNASSGAGDMDFTKHPDAPNVAPGQVGLATWYAEGSTTANGERFDPGAMTAAHRTLPMGTWVEVRRPETGRSVRVRINDRGPFGDSRKVIDVTRRAAEALDMIRDGVVRVELRVVGGP